MIDPGRAARPLILAIVVLALASLFVSLNREALIEQGHGQFYRLFALEEEANIPAWFSASLLLCCALRLRCITWVKDGQEDQWASHWRMLSLLFVFLSVDEIASFHEMATAPVRQALGTSGLLHFAWVVPAAGLLLVFAVVYARFVLQLPRAIRLPFIMAGAVYVTGAIGFEMLGGWWISDQEPGVVSEVYVLLSTAEECLEMSGATLFLHALLQPMILEPRDATEASGRRKPAG